MKTVIERKQLISILEANRAKHRQIFLEAQAKYRELAITQLEHKLRLAREGQRFELWIALEEPVDQTREYDRALRALELDTREQIELEPGDVKCLVMDDWGWKQDFLTKNAVYSNSAREDLAR